jgi:phosphoesterase RecJ-like protein
LIDRADQIAIVSHERPDGDALGSMLGLCLALRERGKPTAAVLPSGMPGRFSFLPGSAEVERRLPRGECLVVAVDAADLDRLSLPNLGRADINVDHHPSNTRYGRVNLVEPQAEATSAILYRLAPQLGLPIGAPVATNLLAALVSDTIGFRTPNVTPDTLRLAAELMEAGADLELVYRKGLVEHSYVALRYWGQGLSRLERVGPVVWSSLTLADRKSVGYPGPDDADLVEMLATVQDAMVAVVFVEQSENQVKISWRARPGTDVGQVAAQFGGGGHTLAAGATLDGPLQGAIEQVLAATGAAVRNQVEAVE